MYMFARKRIKLKPRKRLLGFASKKFIDNSLYIQSNCHARFPQISFWF